ncbi:MAG: YedE-related selenium metabolism membrane protein, partial [Clostridiales bacterium]|nr:YedE-related selenium metabolism membrane protein [Clostridiales bacterium]
MKQKTLGIVLTGPAVGIVSVLLVVLGNPGNMGFCIACFLRDTAGALGLHRAAAVQYLRPEIIGLALGAFLASLAAREHRARGGSSPLTRFVLGVLVMVGALMFLGCPLRMMLRIGGGDLNALVGLAGFACGIFVGVLALRLGFSLRRTYRQGKAEGLLFPVITAGLLLLLVAYPSLLLFSEQGPCALRAPISAALAAGLMVGVLAQRTRLCTVGGIRDAVLVRDRYLLIGFLAIVAAAVLTNLAAGTFRPGFDGQPVAHTDALWNFLGMALTGWASVLLGGCPMRQLVLAAEGNTDSAV